MRLLIFTLAVLLGTVSGQVVEFDKTVHDFGDVLVSDGPLTCTFTVKNISDKPQAIYEVVTSCGCTDVKWTRTPLKPGDSGTISVTYSNDSGPLPFDKTLTVYISGTRKPVILRIRGVVHDKKVSLNDLYGKFRIGPLGFKEADFKIGNMEMGESCSTVAKVANLSDRPVNVTVDARSPQLKVNITPNPIPPGSVAEISLKVNSDTTLWGRNTYNATLRVQPGGATGTISAWAFTKDNFSGLTPAGIRNAPVPTVTDPSSSFGPVSRGTRVNAAFQIANTGNTPLIIRKTDVDMANVTVSSPTSVAPSASASINVNIDTKDLAPGSHMAIITITTNSPTRPIVYLYVNVDVKK